MEDMKKKTPYLDFYKMCLKKGKIPEYGLCNCLGVDVCELFEPPEYLEIQTSLWGFRGEELSLTDDIDSIGYEFTEMRQTIVLLLAVMNNEL